MVDGSSNHVNRKINFTQQNKVVIESSAYHQASYKESRYKRIFLTLCFKYFGHWVFLHFLEDSFIKGLKNQIAYKGSKYRYWAKKEETFKKVSNNIISHNRSSQMGGQTSYRASELRNEYHWPKKYWLISIQLLAFSLCINQKVLEGFRVAHKEQSEQDWRSNE